MGNDTALFSEFDKKTVLPYKLVFHFPMMKYQDGKLSDISSLIATFISEFSDLLTENNLSSNFYVQTITGYYKKSSYPENLLTMFCQDNIDGYHVILLFKKLLAKYQYFEQESIAIEQDSQMLILYPNGQNN